MPPRIRPHGLWDSPLQPQDLAASKRLGDVAWDSDGRTLVWLEGRGAKGVLVAQRGTEAPREVNASVPCRAQVGYGGGDFTVGRGHAYFVAQEGGNLWMQPLDGGSARPITPAFGAAAAPSLSPNGRWVLYVHSLDGSDCLAVVDAQGSQWPRKLAEGADFYMQPAWHRDSRRVAWIEWDHPRMPWEGTRLMVADLRLSTRGDPPRTRQVRQLAGDDTTAVFQPTFSPDGRYLAYTADTTGWSQLYLLDLGSGEPRRLEMEEAEVALPAWIQGLRTFAFSRAGTCLYFTRAEHGGRRAYSYDLETQRTDPFPGLERYTYVEQLTVSPQGEQIACVASAPDIPSRVLTVARQRPRVRARSSAENLAREALARPQAISWRSEDGTVVHGLYYPPTNPEFVSAGEPPLLVHIHGGPTSQATLSYDGRSQFFATRGYAVLQVNHRGSTGYGRAYAGTLQGNWGIHDVEDAISGAHHLVSRKLAAAERIAIMGGSAGGYTVLRALTLHPGFFRAGVCLYGIANLFTLASDTHKFEAHYLDSLLGPLPESARLYRERSPLFSVGRLQDPLAIFQGTEDRVVPAEQTQAMVDSLRRRHVPHEYHVYENEGHGWRRAETITAFYEAVERFLRRHVLYS